MSNVDKISAALQRVGSDFELSDVELADLRVSPAQQQRIETLKAKVETALERSLSAATLRAYRSDWSDFCCWCETIDASPLPASPLVVAAYLADLADPDDDREPRSAATLDRRKSTISRAHETAGVENPTRNDLVRLTLRGIKRSIGTSQNRKRALTSDEIKAMIDPLTETNRLADLRDRTLILLAFHSALRRESLVSLDVADIEDHPQGILVHLRRSKTDQEGSGRRIEIAYASHPDYCAVRTVRRWLNEADITDGPIFRPLTKGDTIKPSRLSAQSVAIIFKKHAARLGIDADDIAGHSTRRGFATQTLRGGAPERATRKTTGHTTATGLDPYIDDAETFTDPPNQYLDL